MYVSRLKVGLLNLEGTTLTSLNLVTVRASSFKNSAIKHILFTVYIV